MFSINTDPAVRLAKLLANECQVMAFPNVADLPGIKSDAALQVMQQPGLNIGYLDAEFRQTQRAVWPLQLSFMDNARVLGAWCELRQGFRFFRTDRIQTAVAAERYPARRSQLLREFQAHLEALGERLLT